MIFIFALLAMVAAYLLGSFSSAIFVCRLLKLPDPRTQGSHNPGATNVLRLGGKFAAALTLLGDIAKGWIPVFVAKQFTDNPWILSAVLLAAVAGHLFPVFFQFKGGKGVATALGALFALSPLLGLLYLITWIIVFSLSRYSSLAGMTAMISMPIWTGILLDRRYVFGIGLLALAVLWRHRENIRRLLAGTEQKFTQKKP